MSPIDKLYSQSSYIPCYLISAARVDLSANFKLRRLRNEYRSGNCQTTCYLLMFFRKLFSVDIDRLWLGLHWRHEAARPCTELVRVQ